MRKFNKAILAILLLVVVMAVALTGCSQSNGSQVVYNHDFELMNEDETNPDGWSQYRSEKTPESDFTRIAVATGSVGSDTLGKSYYSVELNTEAGVAYYYQDVKLYSGVTYEFSVDYKIDRKLTTNSSEKEAIGAYFGFLEDVEYLTLSTIKETDSSDNDWITRTVYFSPNRTSTYTLVAGIGREDIGGAKGEVSFDNVSIIPIDKDAVPVGSFIETISPSVKYDSDMAGGIAYTVIFAVMGAALLVGAYFLVRVIIKKEGYREAIEANINGKIDDSPNDDTNNNDNIAIAEVVVTDENIVIDGDIVSDGSIAVEAVQKKPKLSNKVKMAKLGKTLSSPIFLFIYVLLAAFAVRFIFLVFTGGMAEELKELGLLALTMAQDGISTAYSGSLILPSGMLYILYVIGLFTDAVGITAGSAGMAMLIRIPNVIADIVTCYIIFIMLSKHYNYKITSVFTGVYALLPVIFTASTTWGMSVSIPIACMIGMFAFLLNKNFIGFNALYALSLMFSYSSIILLPLVIALDVYYCVINKKYILPVCITAAVSFIIYYLVALPFAMSAITGVDPTGGALLVFTNFFDVIAQNDLITNNSFNFFAIFGLGFASASTALSICVAILMVIFGSLGFYMFYKSNNGVDAIFLGAMSFIVWGVFGIGSKMEYMVIGIALLFVYATLKTERRLYTAMSILAITAFINIAVLQTNSGFISYYPPTDAGLIPFHYLDPLYIIGSIITTFTTIYLFYVSYDIMVSHAECDIKPMGNDYLEDSRSSLLELKTRTLLRFKKK